MRNPVPAVLQGDYSKYTYNPTYDTDDYHTKWNTSDEWITQHVNGTGTTQVYINEPVPDKYTVDGLVLGAKSASGVEMSDIFKNKLLFASEPSDEECRTKTNGYSWDALKNSAFNCTYGANLILPNLKAEKDAVKNNKSIYIVYKNIGTYKGTTIDLKMTVVDYENYVDWGTGEEKTGVFGFWTEDTRNNSATKGMIIPAISVQNVAWVQITYTFQDSETGKGIQVDGSTSFYDLDFAQAIHLRGNVNRFKGIYVTDVNNDVPILEQVNNYNTQQAQREVFEKWTANDCLLKYSTTVPQGQGVVVYSPHGNDSALASEQYGDTKHAFTVTFNSNSSGELNFVYSFDKGKEAKDADYSTATDYRSFVRNANGSIMHSGVPVYTGSLEIKKEVISIVDGAQDNTEKIFNFEIEFYESYNETTGVYVLDDALDGAFGGVELKDGKGKFSLKAGASVTIKGIPIRVIGSSYGTYYKITELETDGYIVETSMTQQVKGESQEKVGPLAQNEYSNTLQPDNDMVQHQTVTFTNYYGIELPNTGGTGTAPYVAAGLTLILFSIACLVYRTKAHKSACR